MSLEFLVTWLMVLLRTLGVISQLPLVAGRPIPMMAKVGMGMCIATLLVGIVPAAVVPVTLGDLVVAVGGETLVGLALGFVGRLAFAAAEMAGRIITTEVGLTASPGMGIPEPSSEPMAALLSTFAIVLFFLFGGHLMMLSALAKSFSIVVAGRPQLAPDAGESMIAATAHLIELGLRLSAPFIAMNFLVVLSFSALGRVVPKLNPFIISFSVKSIAGLGLLATAGGLIASYLYQEFSDTPLRMLELVIGS
ncbi:MAG TPA: flagellar biosynthetic protein FliR [Opitutus sp.]|nr:flagellar biosynthetic protein FliR [Opitutus sp.]